MIVQKQSQATARPMPFEPFPQPTPKPLPPFIDPAPVLPHDLEDILKDLLPGKNKIPPKFDFFPTHKMSLTHLADKTASQLMDAGSQFEKHRILENFVAELNHADMIMTSYPAKPVYNHSTQELLELANYIQSMPHPKCHCESYEAYQEVLGAINVALKERQPKPMKFPDIKFM